MELLARNKIYAFAMQNNQKILEKNQIHMLK
jgi:hypothetical protein